MSRAKPKCRPKQAGPIGMDYALSSAIENQRFVLAASITTLYCLHSALRRIQDDGGRIESEAVTAACGRCDLSDVTAMLLVQLHELHLALEPTVLSETAAKRADNVQAISRGTEVLS